MVVKVDPSLSGSALAIATAVASRLAHAGGSPMKGTVYLGVQSPSQVEPADPRPHVAVLLRNSRHFVAALQDLDPLDPIERERTRLSDAVVVMSHQDLARIPDDSAAANAIVCLGEREGVHTDARRTALLSTAPLDVLAVTEVLGRHADLAGALSRVGAPTPRLDVDVLTNAVLEGLLLGGMGTAFPPTAPIDSAGS
jgi:hypothetical protein